MEYDLKKVVSYALRVNNIQIDNTKIAKVVKKLKKAGFYSSVFKKDIPYVINAVSSIVRHRHNPLKTVASTNNVQNCPLCVSSASSMVDIKLAGNRKAKYCVEHNVCIPVSVK